MKHALFSLALLLPTLVAAQALPSSDEFDSPATLAQWQRVNVVEGWNADQLQTWDISATRSGWMTMVPYTSTWYANWRGVLAFKPVTGNFAITTRLRAQNRAQTAPPGRQYSLAGIMVRQPRDITPATWTPGGENYVFLSLGSADSPGNYQYEVKTTEASNSVLNISPAPGPEAEIRVVRVGDAFLMLRRDTAGWVVHRRYSRPGFSTSAQAGLTCYTDWPNVSGTDPFTHNGSVITTGQPDLHASFDFVRYRSIAIPEELRAADFSEPAQVSDQTIIDLYGDPLDGSEVASVPGAWMIH